MSQLDTLRKNIDKARQTQKINPADVPNNTRPGVMVAIRQAKDLEKESTTKLVDEVLKCGVGVFLFGETDQVTAFVKALREEGEAAVLDANGLYDQLSEGLYESLGATKEFTPNQAARLNRRLAEMAHDLDIKDPTYDVRWGAMPRTGTKPDLVAYVRAVVRGAAGDALNKTYLRSKLAAEAIGPARYTGHTAPVVLLNSMPGDIEALGAMFGKGMGTFRIPPDEKGIGAETVRKAFKEVSQQIKRSKK